MSIEHALTAFDLKKGAVEEQPLPAPAVLLLAPHTAC